MKFLFKYLNYIDVFSFILVIKLLKNIDLNKHIIKLVEGKQPLYIPIYGLVPRKLKTLKTYIKTY